MSCCPSNIVPFFGVSTSVVPYSDSMKADFGEEPKISLYYLDPDTGVWYTLNGIMGTSVQYDPATSLIHIDHGGIFTGYIKIE